MYPSRTRHRLTHVVVLLAASFGVLGPPRRARSAEPPPQEVSAITLEEALAHARQHQPQIRSALAELRARKSDARIPRAQWMPQVGAVVELIGSTNNNTSATVLNVPEVDLPRIGGTGARTNDNAAWTPAPSTLAGLSLTQEVYDFGRIAAQAGIADARTAIAQANAEAVRLDVQLAVEEAFHGVLGAKAVLAATDEAERRATTHRDYARAGTKSGLRPPIDLTRAEADVARLEVRRIRAVSGLRAARAALAAAIGSTALEIDARPRERDESPAPAFDEALRVAAQRNPAIHAAQAKVTAQANTTSAITHELMPNLFATAGLSGRAGGIATSNGASPYGGGWLPDVPNWHLGLVLAWNVFDGATLARRSASLAREDAARADLELTRIATNIGAERAYLDLDAALRALPGLRQSIDAARANQAQAEARFKAGLGTVVELADAEALLTNSQLELAVGEFAIARSRASLGHMMGAAAIPGPRDPGRRP
jgi:outer membrane protein TolC